MADLIGLYLGQYEITALLGKGGMASVYRARQTSMERDVAIKVIKPELAETGDFVVRFRREARTVASLSHPFILKVFDYGQQGDLVYLVMELLTGGSLADQIQRRSLSLDEVARLLDQIASALDYAHERGIIHRDLKPQNVLLDEKGNAVLTDFGIVKLLAETTALTQSGMAMGTPTYMSPEQWKGLPADARSDIYALGVMLFEMLTGRVPFKADTPFGLMHQHVYDPPPSVLDLRSDVPPGVDAMIQKALDKDPDQRWSSAGDMAAAFKAALAGQPSVSTPPRRKAVGATLIETPVSTADRRRTPQLVGGSVLIILLVLMGMLAFLTSQHAQTSQTPTVLGMALQATTSATATALVPSSTPLPLTDSPGSVPNAATLIARVTVTANIAATTGVIVARTETAQAITAFTPTPTATSTPTPPPTASWTPTVTPVPPTAMVTPSVVPTIAMLSASDLENTVQAEMNLRLTANAQTVVAGLTATARLWTATPTMNIPETANARLTATQFAAFQQTTANAQTRAPQDNHNRTTPQWTASPTVQSIAIVLTTTLSFTTTSTPSVSPATTESSTGAAITATSFTKTPTVRLTLSSTDTPLSTETFTPSPAQTPTAKIVPIATNIVIPTSTTTPTPMPTATPMGGGTGTIAFASNREGKHAIYLMDADGSNVRRLTNNTRVEDYAPAWSPDGTKIAFTSSRDSNNEIYVMNADGSNQRNLSNNPAVDYGAAWSPDGLHIAFASTRDKHSEVYIMNADGTGQRNLTNTRGGANEGPSWSPDGQSIAFSSNRSGNFQLYFMNADGSNQRRLTNDTAKDAQPAWSPDGRFIAFTSDRGGFDAIYVVDINSLAVSRLTDTVSFSPAWSPDGQHIIFTSNRDRNNEIYIMDADGSNQHNLTNNGATDFNPAWQPHGGAAERNG